jgi:hypothetical protein
LAAKVDLFLFAINSRYLERGQLLPRRSVPHDDAGRVCRVTVFDEPDRPRGLAAVHHRGGLPALGEADEPLAVGRKRQVDEPVTRFERESRGGLPDRPDLESVCDTLRPGPLAAGDQGPVRRERGGTKRPDAIGVEPVAGRELGVRVGEFSDDVVRPPDLNRRKAVDGPPTASGSGVVGSTSRSDRPVSDIPDGPSDLVDGLLGVDPLAVQRNGELLREVGGPKPGRPQSGDRPARERVTEGVHGWGSDFRGFGRLGRRRRGRVTRRGQAEGQAHEYDCYTHWVATLIGCGFTPNARSWGAIQFNDRPNQFVDFRYRRRDVPGNSSTSPQVSRSAIRSAAFPSSTTRTKSGNSFPLDHGERLLVMISGRRARASRRAFSSAS